MNEIISQGCVVLVILATLCLIDKALDVQLSRVNMKTYEAFKVILVMVRISLVFAVLVLLAIVIVAIFLVVAGVLKEAGII